MSFFRVYIEITNVCGLNCDFCTPKFAKPKTMNLEFFEKILKQLKTKEIALHVLGDPLLNKDLKNYLDLAKSYKFKVFLVTSGFYLKNHDFSTLLHTGVSQLNISLNSQNKNSKKLAFDEYFESIFSLIDYKIKNDTNNFINLRLWNLDDAKSEKEFNEKVFLALNAKFGLHIKQKDGEKSVRIAKKVRLQYDEYFEWPDLSNKIYPDSKCLGLSSQIAILADGRVAPCCLDANADVNLGDVNKDTLSKILENSSKIANGLKIGKPTEELCKKCSYRLRFLGEKK